MNSHGVYRLFIFALIVLIGGIGFLLWRAVENSKAENAELLLDEERLIDRVKELAEEKAYKEEYYFRLLHDEDFAGRVIRQKLGFVGVGELVFKFEDSAPVSIDDPFESKVAPALNSDFQNQAQQQPTAVEGSAPKKAVWESLNLNTDSSQKLTDSTDNTVLTSKDNSVNSVKIEERVEHFVTPQKSVRQNIKIRVSTSRKRSVTNPQNAGRYLKFIY